MGIKAKKSFLMFLLFISLVFTAFGVVKNFSIRSVGPSGLTIDTRYYAILTPGILINDELIVATLQNDSTVTKISADITLKILSGDWNPSGSDDVYIKLRLKDIEIKANETKVLSNKNIISDYLGDMAVLENKLPPELKNITSVEQALTSLELKEGRYKISMAVFEHSGSLLNKLGENDLTVNVVTPTSMYFIKKADGSSITPTLSWKLSMIPIYASLPITSNPVYCYSKLIVSSTDGTYAKEIKINHSKPSSGDLKGYPSGDGVTDGVYTYTVTGTSGGIILRRGKTYRFKVELYDWYDKKISETSEETVEFDTSEVIAKSPVSDIKILSPKFEWSYKYNSEVGYYKLIIEGFKTYSSISGLSFQMSDQLSWGRSYRWKVVPFYSDGTVFIEEAATQWNSFSTAANNKPVTEIIFPSEGSLLIKGRSYSFKATSSEPDKAEGIDDDITATWWEVGSRKYTGNDLSFTPEARTGSSPLKITYKAQDKYNNIGQSQVNVFVIDPYINITKPKNSSTGYVGDEITFECISQDVQEITWYANSKPISPKHTFSTAGSYEITAKATVQGIEIKSPSITINIIEKPSLQAITDPELTTYQSRGVTLKVGFKNLDPAKISWKINASVSDKKGDSFNFVSDTSGTFIIKAFFETAEVVFTVNVKKIPAVKIISPVDTSVLNAQEDILFKAQASDYTELVWYIDSKEFARGASVSFSFDPAYEGEHLIRLRADDLDIPAANDSVRIKINVVKELVITEPVQDPFVTEVNSEVTFTAKVKNLPEPSWYVGTEKKGIGSSFKYLFSTTGEYKITVSSNSFTDTVTVKVVGQKYLTIASPKNGTVVEIDKVISFTSDSKNIRSDIVWYINDEEVVKGSSMTYTFQKTGTYKVKASGDGYSDEITITAVPPEKLSIVYPLNNQQVYINKDILFQSESSDLRSSIIWVVNGSVIGQGESILYKFINPGNYTITAKSSTKETAVQITAIEPQSISILSPSDSLIKLSSKVKLTAKSKYPDEIKWFIDSVLIGTGDSVEYIFDKPGKQLIKAQTNDAQAEKEITVYTPVADLRITSERYVYYSDELATFSCSFNLDSYVGLKNIQWLIDGNKISDKNILNIDLTLIPAGLHSLVVTVTDNQSNSVSSSITFDVVSHLDYEITSPKDNKNINSSEVLRLNAKLTKGLTKDIKSIEWFINSKSVGSGWEILASNPGKGTTDITLVIKDRLEKEYKKSITVSISDKLEVKILKPSNFSLFKYGQEIKATAQAYLYTEKGMQLLDSKDIKWFIDDISSNGSGILFINNLSIGSHKLKAVYDQSYDEVSIEVSQPRSIVITEPADNSVINSGSKLLCKAQADDSATINWYIGSKKVASGKEVYIDTKEITGKFIIKAESQYLDFFSEASVNVSINEKPVITWISPKDGEVFASGAKINIKAEVTDYEDGKIPYTLFVDNSEIQGTALLNAADLGSGEHMLTIATNDSNKLKTISTIKIRINEPPKISLISPLENQEFTFLSPINLSCSVSDDEPLKEENILWFMDNTQIAKGSNASYTQELSQGVHKITVRYSDSMNEQISKEITFKVLAKPSVKIYTPVNGQTVNLNEKITLKAWAFKADGKKYTPSEMLWFIGSTPAGQGEQIDFTALSKEPVIITCRTTEASDNITLNINTPPVVRISSHPDGYSIMPSEVFVVKADVYDSQENTDPSRITWQVDGKPSGTGISVNLSDLEEGEHLITVSASDSMGLKASYSIRVNKASVLRAQAKLENDSVYYLFSDKIKGSIIFSGGVAPVTVSWTVKQPGKKDIVITTPQLDINGELLSEGPAILNARISDSKGSIVEYNFEITIIDNLKVQITGVEDGSTFVKPTENIQASLKVYNPRNLSVSYTWTVNGQPVSNLKELSLETKNYNEGSYFLKAVAVSSDGTIAEDGLTIFIRPKLKVEIRSKVADHTENYDLQLLAIAFDPLEGELDNSSISWISNLQGELGKGKTITIKLRKGKHIITAVATNKSGQKAYDYLTVVVLGNPEISIVSPSENSVFNEGEQVPLKSIASDSDMEPINDKLIAWSSNIDGAIGFGSSVSTSSLSVGQHVITATCTGKYGGLKTASIQIEIMKARNISKGLKIAKDKNSLVLSDTSFKLECYRIGDITGDVVWFSDIEGKIGEGDSTTALLKTPGAHTITANLNEYSDSITILVTEYKPRLIPYGIVLDLKGEVKIKNSTNNSFVPLIPLTVLYENDELSLTSGSFVKIMKANGSSELVNGPATKTLGK